VSPPDSRETGRFEPRRPAIIAAVIFALVALTLFLPMLSGKILLGHDQITAGYSFRSFAAEWFRAKGAIPLWNPYIFGGMPFIAASSGDYFYPTSWLRVLMPVGVAMSLSYALHIFLAGCTMYAFLRALRLSWTSALVGGLAYELSGILVSMVSPGHDGKLFVSSLAPLAFLALLRGVRDQRVQGYALLALVVGLCLLSPHYQMTYYLLVAAALWTIYLVFSNPEWPVGRRRWLPLGAAAAAVGLGFLISAIQTFPFLSYLPFSPRAAGGPSTGWEYATSYALPLPELMVSVLPQFNGVLDHYWGSNFFKAHTEYLGGLVVVLAAFGIGDRKVGRLRWILLGIGGLFLLVALGAHTPFYTLWYELMPMMKKVRAPGMAFFLVALTTVVLAAHGVERLLQGRLSPRAALIGAGVLGALAFLGVLGVLQAVAEAIVLPQMADRAVANASELRAGSLRLLVVALAGGAALWAGATGRLRGPGLAAALAFVVAADLWSIGRLFIHYMPPTSELFADDAIITRLAKEPRPFRVFNVPGSRSYRGAFLMAKNVQEVFGYHGNEVRFYDELWGGKNEWVNMANPNLWDLFAVRFAVLPQDQPLPGYHKVVGPVATAQGAPGVLFERDSAAPYVRIVPAAAKIPDSLTVATVIDARFPVGAVALYSDTASVTPDPLTPGALPAPSAVRPTLAEWEPGRMRITLEGADAKPSYLLIAETWYPEWRATVDGREAAVLRADHALLSVVVPAGAQSVELSHHSPIYQTGKLVTLAALLLTAGLIAVPMLPRWRAVRV
jgi:hypothetical protein